MNRTMAKLNLKPIHPTLLPLVQKALSSVESSYLTFLEKEESWLPGAHYIFNAFSISLSQIHYLLFGESPYPRKQSANGYAFWDAAVQGLWTPHGLSKEINKATSLRNLLKMLLIARKDITAADTSQTAIANVDKILLVKTAEELFENFRKHGFMLLNATLVLSSLGVKKDAKSWLPFMDTFLKELSMHQPKISLILLGHVARWINKLESAHHFPQFQAEHPYNISFIHNKTVQDFFRPFDLLAKGTKNDIT
jgi:uracil-DNA glycosylase